MGPTVTHIRWRDHLGEVAVPVLSFRSRVPGPTAVITANVHGDELTGTSAVMALREHLPGVLTRGAVVLVPSLNPRGLADSVRTFGRSGDDLNRLFPGDAAAEGSRAFVAALWRALVALHPDALVDLHADSVASVPYVIVDRTVAHRGAARAALDATLLGLAQASGLTVLHDYPDDEYVRFGLDRSLAGAVVNHLAVPALTLESGPRGRIVRAAVDVAVTATLGVLRHLGVVGGDPARSVSVAGGPWRRGSGPRVRRAGLFVPLRAPGQRFSRGDVLGQVRSLLDEVLEEVRAHESGVVVAWSDPAWVSVGTAVGTLAFAEGRERT